jgi:hypothetical protein
MMKRLVLASLGLALLLVSVAAHAREFLLEAKGSYYLFTNDTTRHIYHHGSGMFTAELSAKLANDRECCVNECDCCCDSCWSHWYGWISAGYLQKKGHVKDTIGNTYKTKMNLIPIGIGLKYLWNSCWGDFYLGAGVLAARIKTHDHSPFVVPCRDKWGAGFIVKGGFLWDFCCCWFIDLFADYSFIRVKFHDATIQGPILNAQRVQIGSGGMVQGRKANASGFELGLGIGYRFN